MADNITCISWLAIVKLHFFLVFSVLKSTGGATMLAFWLSLFTSLLKFENVLPDSYVCLTLSKVLAEFHTYFNSAL